MRIFSVRLLKLLAAGLAAGSVLGSAHAGNCDHPYFAVPGTFTYRTAAAGQIITSSSTIKLVGDTMTVNGTAAGQPYSVVYDCKGGNVTLRAGSNPKRRLGVTNQLPPANLWKVGYGWTTDTKTQGMSTHSTYRIVGSERVTVPAGTFTALRVESSTSMDLGQIPGGKALPPGLAKSMKVQDVKMTSWFAKGVGIVKQTGDNLKMELIKISR